MIQRSTVGSEIQSKELIYYFCLIFMFMHGDRIINNKGNIINERRCNWHHNLQ